MHIKTSATIRATFARACLHVDGVSELVLDEPCLLVDGDLSGLADQVAASNKMDVLILPHAERVQKRRPFGYDPKPKT